MSRQLTSGVLGRRRRGKDAALLLDIFPDSVTAYSLRLLRTTYTGDCLRVRRDSDDTEMDIGFSKGIIDKSALLDFVGAGNGYVSIWYNQGETGGNAIQAILDNQPIIVESGAMLEGVYLMQNSGIHRSLNYVRPYIASQANVTIFTKVKLIESISLYRILGNSSGPIRDIELYYTNGGDDLISFAGRGAGQTNTSVSQDSPDINYSSVFHATGQSFNRNLQKLSVNSSEVTEIDLDADFLGAVTQHIGRKSTNRIGSAYINEIIFWNIDYFNMHNEIQENINSWNL